MHEPGDEIKLEKDAFVLQERLPKGEGSYGVVWRAARKSDGLPVALKLAQTRHPDTGDTYSAVSLESVKKSFRREIDFLARIGEKLSPEGKKRFVELIDSNHPDKSPEPAIAMTLCDFTLGEWDAKRRRDSEAYPFDSKLLFKWMRQLASAVAALRELDPSSGPESSRLLTEEQMESSEGFVLRDLKPENVLVQGGRNGDLRLSDFGTARRVTSKRTDTIGCTPEWAAPECLISKVPEEVPPLFALSPKVDVYSLALVYYFLITGRDDTTAQKKIRGRVLNIPIAFGSVGRLTRDEKDGLVERCLELFSPGETGPALRKKNLTIVDGLAPASPVFLPDKDAVAEEIADMIDSMMAPLAEERPSAAHVLETVARLDDTLHPSIKIELRVEKTFVPTGTPVKAAVLATGKGIPDHAGWLRILIDGKPFQTRLVPVADRKGVWKFDLPGFSEKGLFKVAAVALVNGERIEDEKRIRAVPLADWLWEKGRRADALIQDPNRRERLRELDAEAAQEPAFLTEYAAILEKALEKHPDNAKINKRYWWIVDWMDEREKGDEDGIEPSRFPFGPQTFDTVKGGSEKAVNESAENESAGGDENPGKPNGSAPAVADRRGDVSIHGSGTERPVTTKPSKPRPRRATAVAILMLLSAVLGSFGGFWLGDFRRAEERSVEFASADKSYETIVDLTNEKKWDEAKAVLRKNKPLLKKRLESDRYGHLEDLENFWRHMEKGDALAARKPVVEENLEKAKAEYVEAKDIAILRLPKEIVVSPFAKDKIDEISERLVPTPQPVPATGGRFALKPNGVVWDSHNEIYWRAKDNGRDIPYEHENKDGYDAGKYLEEMNRDWNGDPDMKWRLPTSEELMSLYNGKAECIKRDCGYCARMETDLIDITCNWFWYDNDSDNPGSRFGVVYLVGGDAGSGAPWNDGDGRVLVVRRGN